MRKVKEQKKQHLVCSEKQVLKTAKGRKISSTTWLLRRINDPYVASTKKLGYRSRAAAKLIDIEDKFHVINAAKNCIVDLGSYPGSWLQVVLEKKRQESVVIGVDLCDISPLVDVHFVHGDFTESTIVQCVNQLAEHITTVQNTRKIDLVLSDMAPATCGMKDVDQIRITDLAQHAFIFVKSNLQSGGNFVVKIFMCSYMEELLQEMRKCFKKVVVFKPQSSYSNSSENFVICMGFILHNMGKEHTEKG